MKYEYITSTGKTEIEVDEQFYELLIAMDKEEYNSNRRHSRRFPVPLGDSEYEGDWLEDSRDTPAEVEAKADMERAMASLTELQRICFVETRLNGKSQREVAAELGKSRSTVQLSVERAVEILKKTF